jgi:hypothetical protein
MGVVEAAVDEVVDRKVSVRPRDLAHSSTYRSAVGAGLVSMQVPPIPNRHIQLLPCFCDMQARLQCERSHGNLATRMCCAAAAGTGQTHSCALKLIASGRPRPTRLVAAQLLAGKTWLAVNTQL